MFLGTKDTLKVFEVFIEMAQSVVKHDDATRELGGKPHALSIW